MKPLRLAAAWALLALVTATTATAAFIANPVLTHHAAAAAPRAGLRGARVPSLRAARLQHARLSMNGDADSASSAAVQEEQVPKRSKARMETGYSNAPFLGDAIQQALREAAGKMPEGVVPHAVLVCVNSLYCNDGLVGETVTTKDGREIKAGNEKYGRAMGLVARQLSQRGWTDLPVVGMSVGGNVCEDKEYEGADNGAGISITLLYVPGSTVMPFRVPDDMNESWRPDDWTAAGLRPDGFTPIKLTPPYTPKDDAVIFLFGHPESPIFTKKVLEGLDFAFARAKKVGAVAGTALENHEASIFMLPKIAGANLNVEESACFDTGVVGLAISGNIAVDAVVAQGSRPIGPNFEVMETDMNGTVITRLRDISTGSMTEGAPTTLFDMAGFAGMIDQKDVQSAVNYIGLGVSVTPLEEDIDKHQYIVRPITELQKDGPIFLPDPVRVGQVVRYHVRDNENAEAELSSLRARWKLERASRALDGMFPAGCLVFSDQARGKRLFGSAGVEAQGFAKDFPGTPLGGAFVDGAIGQLPNFGGDRNLEPLFKDGTGTPKRVGVVFDQIDRGSYLHGVGSAYLMIYGESEEAGDAQQDASA